MHTHITAGSVVSNDFEMWPLTFTEDKKLQMLKTNAPEYIFGAQ
jgi:hypothetical protein